MNWKFLFIIITPFLLLFGCFSYVNNYEPEEKTWPAKSTPAECYENEEFGCNWAGQKYNKITGKHYWPSGSQIGG